MDFLQIYPLNGQPNTGEVKKLHDILLRFKADMATDEKMMKIVQKGATMKQEDVAYSFSRIFMEWLRQQDPDLKVGTLPTLEQHI